MRNRADIRAVTGKIFTETKLAGGDINEVIHLRAEKGDFVLKTNNDPPPGLFASEAAGLASLRERALRVPEVYLAGEDFLLMQFFSPGSAQPYEAGEMLARLHVEPQLNYGFEAPTYLAALLQENKPQASWSEFYVRYRIEPLLHGLGVAEKEEDVAMGLILQDNSAASWIHVRMRRCCTVISGREISTMPTWARYLLILQSTAAMR